MPPVRPTTHLTMPLTAVASFFLLIALAFDRTSQIQFTLPKLIVLRFCGAGLVLLWAWRAHRDSLEPIPRLVLVPATLLISWWIVVTPLAVDMRTALHGMHGRYNGLINHATMMGLFFVVATSAMSRATIRRSMILCIAALVPVVVYALAQSIGADPLIWPNSRPGSTIGHPVPLAAILGLAIPFVLAFLISETHPVFRWVWAALLGLFLIATAGTLSRGPQIGVAMAMVIVLSAAVKARAIEPGRILVPLAAIGMAGALMLARDTNPITRFTQRLAQMAQIEADPSFTNRFVYFRAAYSMIRDHPIAGIGFESFGLLYPRYRPIEAEQVPADTIPTMVHNGYLQAAATTGLPGLIFYLALAISIIVLLARTCVQMASSAGNGSPPRIAGAARRDWLIGIAFIASMAGYLVQDLSGWLEISLSAFFWTIAGAAVSYCAAGPAADRWHMPARWRTPAAVAGAMASIALVALAFDAWSELRADRAFFQSHFLDVNRDWPAIEDNVAAGLRLVGDDPYYQDAAGVLYLKRFHASGDRDAYDRSAALLDRAAQTNHFDPYILIHRVDLDTAALQRKLVAMPSESASRAVGALLLMDRNNPSVHEAVANFRAALGRFSEALESIRKAETLRPHHPRYHMAEGDALRAIGDRAGAATAYRLEATLLTTGDPDWLTVERKLVVTLVEAERSITLLQTRIGSYCPAAPVVGPRSRVVAKD